MIRNMHVCLVTVYPVRDDVVMGGVEAASLRLVDALQARGGVKITVVAPAAASSIERRGDIDIHWTRSGPSFLPGILRYWSTERRSLQSAVRIVGADVVHFQATAGWGLGFDGPRVFQMHGVMEDAIMHSQRWNRRISRWILLAVEGRGRRSFPIVAVVGAHMVGRFGRQFTGDVVVAENTVPDSYFEIQRTPVSGRILFGGVVSNRKNTLGLLQAFAQVLERAPDSELHIAGDLASFPAYANECVQFAKQRGIGSAVKFLGPISIDRMRSELAEADVVVLPSFNESAPIIICEAMAAGVPVISSRRDGMVKMIDEGTTGYLIEPDNLDELRDRILDLITNPDRNLAFGAAGRSSATGRFSSEALAATMVSCYQKAIDSAGSPL